METKCHAGTLEYLPANAVPVLSGHLHTYYLAFVTIAGVVKEALQ